ncbi:MAG TPA: hypothetical protein VLJ61_04020 [Pyrinomonadaceae bacterium]|nr:hypothetical protein [Pyrinomonadaceae bacterium]
MSAAIVNQKLLGLIEMDADGVVLYSRIERDDRHLFSTNITGRNFYTEVAPFQNIEEFQKCLESFMQSSQQANSITFTCQYDDGPLKVKVLLARVRERSEGDVSKSILMHIRKAQ